MSPADGRRILRDHLFLSPEKSFHLPVYAEKLAQASLNISSYHFASSQYSGDRRVLKYFDVSAIEDGTSSSSSSRE